MKNTSILLILALLVLGCHSAEKINPIGFWKGDSEDLLITENEDYFLVKRKGHYLEYMTKSSNQIKFVDDKLLVEFKDKSSGAFYKATAKEELPVWVISKGQSRSFFTENFNPPDTIIISQAGAEKWFYQNGKVLIFDKTSLFKITENHKVNRNFDEISLGMSKQEVSLILGSPDRQNKRKTKWFYGTKKMLLFRENILKDIRPIEIFNSFSSWREEALSTFDDSYLLQRDPKTYLSQLEKSKRQILLSFQVNNISKLYGIKERKDQTLPLILIAELNQTSFPPSLYRLEKELRQFSADLEKHVIETYPTIVKSIEVIQPSLNKQRKLIEIASSLTLKSGETILNRQAIFFRHDKMLIIQMSTYKEDEKFMSYYDKILDDFDI